MQVFNPVQIRRLNVHHHAIFLIIVGGPEMDMGLVYPWVELGWVESIFLEFFCGLGPMNCDGWVHNTVRRYFLPRAKLCSANI